MKVQKNKFYQNNFFLEEIYTLKAKTFMAEDVYVLLHTAYSNVKGGLHFANIDELILSTNLWQLIYYQDKLVGAVVYKAKQGLKMVAMAINHNTTKKIRTLTKDFLAYLFKKSFSKIWMEVSEAAEKFILKIGGDKFLIPNNYATDLTNKDIKVYEKDGYHYKREIQGIVKTKIIIGTPKMLSNRQYLTS